MEVAETWTDERLVRKMAGMARTGGTDQLLLLSKELFPGHDEPLNREVGWWYTPKERVSYRKCKHCQSAKLTEDYNFTTRGGSRAECKSCEDENARRRNKRNREAERSSGPRPPGRSLILQPNGIRLNGLLCRNADPRYAGLGDDPSGGDVVLTAEQVRGCLR